MAHSRKITGIALSFALVVVAAPPSAAAQRQEPVRITRFLGEQRIAHLATYEGTTVGGLSGLDRDPGTGTWYLISDDRWRYNPARFYTGRLDINRETGEFTGVRLTGVTTLTRADGTPYPAYGKAGSADPESIRLDPWSGRLLWGDEGDRPDPRNPNIPVSQSAVHTADLEGRSTGELPVPANLRLTDAERGPRRNFGFEGLAVTERTVTAVTEGPRFEDGPVPTAERGSPARLTVWNRRGQVRGQYAYPLDRLPTPPKPATGDADSGVSEILPIDEHRYLALERSWIQGVGYRVKLYEIDVRGATNVLGRDSLTGDPYWPVSKRLVHNLGDFRPPVQNLESMSWGPRLASGECTLVIGSDDNFDGSEATLFMAFAATGCRRG
ncbi:esterase-like activity of phytase family protein [Nonomuraea antimicrobica]|uniref:Esterase-like activity of phytase family protein n=1 Tax=Nonomuraea antimicrobica TaxID=561173 RepID=A0ABP7CFQ5_9ACTN